MKLLTKEIEKKLLANPLYSGEGEKNHERQVVAKFFNPSGAGTWYVTEGERQGDDWLFFGLADLHEAELGYFTLSELSSIKCPPFGLPIERDLYWSGTLEDAYSQTSS